MHVHVQIEREESGRGIQEWSIEVGGEGRLVNSLSSARMNRDRLYSTHVHTPKQKPTDTCVGLKIMRTTE